MSDLVYARIDDDLRPLEETEFPTEGELQKLLAAHPALLAGTQIDPGNPRQFALVAREIPIPDEAGGSGRWSLDHLFVDQLAIPTFVEVKRASNPQLRREVVGQILDYAANAVRYWQADDLVEAFRATHGSRANEMLAELLGEDEEHEEFWQTAETNLRDGRVRLVFVADRIPTELQGIIEFLNERLDPTEVLGVELKQYRAAGAPQVLVPRVIGNTAVAKRTKGATVPYEDRIGNASTETRALETKLREWAGTAGIESGTTRAARRFMTPEGVHLFFLYPRGDFVEFTMQSIREGDPDTAERILAAMRAISSKALTDLHPNLATEDLLEHWESVTQDILPVYVEARRRHGGSRRP